MAKMINVPVEMSGSCSGCGANVAATITHSLPEAPGSSAVCNVSAGCGSCGTTVHLSGVAQL